MKTSRHLYQCYTCNSTTAQRGRKITGFLTAILSVKPKNHIYLSVSKW